MRKTKTGLIKEHLEKRGNITSWDAIQLYAATRLAAIIFNLRKRGMQIHNQDCVKKDKYKNDVRFTKYIYQRSKLH